MPKIISFLLLCGATLILFTQTFASPSGGLQPAGFLPMIIQSSGSAVTPTATATATVSPSITPTPSNTPTATATPINQLPVAQFTSSVVTGTLPLEVTLDNTSFDPDDTIANSAWDFGDGVTRTYTNTGPHTAHVFTQPGTFTITLTVTDNAGLTDSTTLPITVLPNQFYTGCPAQPIGVNGQISSVTIQNFPTFANPAYPVPGPTYDDFSHHLPAVALSNAHTGYVYYFNISTQPDAFYWLSWNKYLNANASNLGNALLWPGINEDYFTAGANGQVPPGINPVTNEPFTHPVYGFIDVLDDTDFVLQEEDWIAINAGVSVSNEMTNILGQHIDQQKLLRLPLWQNSMGTGSSSSVQMTQFAWFKLQGYKFSANDSWLLLEFVEFDEQCGQIIEP